jgi:hypothetical protein
MTNNSLNIILGSFLLLVIISGTYITPIINCETLYIFQKNIIFRNLFIIFVIFFEFSLFTDNTTPPHYNIIESIKLWLFFIIFNKMNKNFTIISFLIIILIILIKSYMDYYQRIGSVQYLDLFKNTYNFLIYFNIVVIIIGFGLNYLKKNKNGKISLMKYIFSVNNCK